MSTQKQKQFVNVKLEVVKEIETSTGGLVIVYLATPESILKEFYIATLDDNFMEVAWGLGDTIEDALENAEKEWDRLRDEIEEDGEEAGSNPFSEALQKLNTEKKLTKEELQEMCRELEKTATSEHDGDETQICNFVGNGRVWIDQKDLDWLADDVGDSTARKMRKIMKYGIDSQGGYYYYDFEE